MSTRLTGLSIFLNNQPKLSEKLALNLLWDLVVDHRFKGIKQFQHTSLKLWYLVDQTTAENIKSVLENRSWNDEVYNRKRKDKRIKDLMSAMQDNGWGTFETNIFTVTQKITRIEITPYRTG